MCLHFTRQPFIFFWRKCNLEVERIDESATFVCSIIDFTCSCCCNHVTIRHLDPGNCSPYCPQRQILPMTPWKVCVCVYNLYLFIIAHTHTYTHMYTYIYIKRERERGFGCCCPAEAFVVVRPTTDWRSAGVGQSNSSLTLAPAVADRYATPISNGTISRPQQTWSPILPLCPSYHTPIYPSNLSRQILHAVEKNVWAVFFLLVVCKSVYIFV